MTCERSGSDAKEPTEKCLTSLVDASSKILSTVTDPTTLSRLIDVAETDVCFKPCPQDCILSEWTAWSDCKGKCIGEQTSKTKRYSCLSESTALN